MNAESPSPMPVLVVGFNMPFWQLVLFMVKAAIAAVPALIILSMIAIAMVALLKSAAEALWSSHQQTSHVATQSNSLGSSGEQRAGSAAEFKQRLLSAQGDAYVRCNALHSDAARACAWKLTECAPTSAAVDPTSLEARASFSCYEAAGR